MSTKLKSNATKAEAIEQYEALLDEHREKVRALDEAKKRLTELEKKVAQADGETAVQATVPAVIETVGRLRGQIGATLNDITDEMSRLAERLESHRRAVAQQEKRIEELHHIDASADALAKLVAAYEERRVAEEETHAGRLAAMERELTDKKATAEGELSDKTKSLETAIAQQRAAWTEEQAKEKRRREEERAFAEKERAREEAEFKYERDRRRKLDEDAYQEKKVTIERELVEKKETAEKELKAREEAVAAREQRLSELEQKVAAIPDLIRKAAGDADAAARKELTQSAEQRAKLVEVERDWERKMAEQRTQHLEQALAQHEKTIAALNAELAKAQAQVNEVAKKAIEGASLHKAFDSVNRIALEQARPTEGKGGSERTERR